MAIAVFVISVILLMVFVVAGIFLFVHESHAKIDLQIPLDATFIMICVLGLILGVCSLIYSIPGMIVTT